jgi:hypothetical protein
VSQLRLSPLSRSVNEVKDKLLRDVAVRDQEIFWISDFQKSTTGNVRSSRGDSLFNWHLVPITFEELANVFIDTVYLDNPFASSGEKNIMRAKVRNDGKQNVEQLTVKLSLNGVQSGSATISVPAGGITEAAFDLTTRLTGLNKAVLTFNDYPISFDNEFYFSLNYKDKIRILEIKNSENITPIERVFGNRQIFTYKGFPISNFNYSLLNEAELVVINGLNVIDPSLQTALREYMNKGGVVLLIPGREPNTELLKGFLQLPILNRADNRNTELQELDKPEYNNPFFENVFEERSASLVMPKAKPVIDWGGDRTSILQFKNDKPFLSVFTGSGTTYLLASPLETSFTDFFNHALFVPVMYRIAASSKKTEQKLYYNLKETLLSLRLDSLREDDQVKLVNEEEIIPSQRKIGQLVTLDLPRFTLKTGFYNVVSGRDTIDLLAFNADKTESLMEQYSVNDIVTFFGNGDNISIFDASDTGTFSNQIKERYLGTPLWKYAILLALVFLLAEVLLIRFLK